MSKLVHMLSAAGVLAVAAGAAFAAEKNTDGLLLGAAPAATPSKNSGVEGAYFRTGQVANFNVAGIESREGISNPANHVVTLNLGAGASVTGLSWNVVITALGTSWQSEARVVLTPSNGDLAQGISLAPGAGVNTPGEGAFASTGVLKFGDNGLPNIFLPDGILRMEFFESYDDGPGVDGIWKSGNLGIQFIPAPSAVALLGLGGLAAARRRRA